MNEDDHQSKKCQDDFCKLIPSEETMVWRSMMHDNAHLCHDVKIFAFWIWCQHMARWYDIQMVLHDGKHVFSFKVQGSKHYCRSKS